MFIFQSAFRWKGHGWKQTTLQNRARRSGIVGNTIINNSIETD